MERFHEFCEMFANFPRLQNELSLLDKPMSNGQNGVSGAGACKLTTILK